MKQKGLKYILYSVFIFLQFYTFAQKQTNHGTPLMHNYTPNEYGGHIQNWSIVQDKRGVMYFANGGSILEYDGKEWRMIHLKFTRSLAIDGDGVIYAGGFNEFGYFMPDSAGNLFYNLLNNKIDEKYSEFSDIWKIHVIDDKVYFLADDKLFIYENDEIKVMESKTASFDMSFVVNGEYFVYLLDKGLAKLTGDSLKLIVSKEEFFGNKIMTMLPFAEKKILIVTRKSGLFLLDENGVYPYKTDVDEFLKKNQIISGIILSDRRYAFGTITGGLIITDKNGNYSRIINQENGLQDNTVINILEDRDGGLFLALFNGITRVEINSPFRLYDDKTGLQGSVYAVIKHNNTVYASTSQGVFYLYDNEITNKSGTDWIEYPAKFRKVPQINSQCYSFTPFSKGKNDKSVLVGSNIGVFEIVNDPADKFSIQGKLIFPYKTAVFTMHRSDFDTSRVLMGFYDGFGSIRYDDNEWIYEGKIESVKENIRSIGEDIQGNIWLGTAIQGVLLLSYDFTEAKVLKICRFDSLNGLPQGEIWIKDYNNTICFATLPNGIYKIQGLEIPSAKSPHESTHEISCINSEIKFIPDTAYRNLSNRKIFPYATVEDCAGNIWAMRKEDDESWTTGVVFKNDPEWAGKWFSKPFDRVKDIPTIILYPESDRIIWFGGGDKLFRYDHNIKQDLDRKFYALIRAVISGNDSVLFYGTNYDTNKTAVIRQPDGLKPFIDYSNNSLTFEYSSPFFDDEWSNKFQYFLDGFDDDWSQWSSETKKEYTNLPEGTYFFRVRAKNIYNNISEETVYEFTILPPWYRTIWAYIAYILLFFTFIYIMLKLNSRILKAKNLRLQKIIEKNTAEIRQQKEKIEQKNKDITDSIQYAKRIQEAILTSSEYCKQILPQHFILFKPKDIVSGDFYWAYASKNNTAIWTVADCTGHGVPGAFMSMIGSSLLNEIIIDKGITSADEILNELKSHIIKALGQTGATGEARDGMDAALCIWYKDTNKLEYAGANNPLCLIRNVETRNVETRSASSPPATHNTNPQLIEIKPDKQPIGYEEDKEAPFTKHEIQLQKGDTIYTFSDGYKDQFGGPNDPKGTSSYGAGKKFSYKRFKELLLSIQDKSMQEQKEILDKTIEDWKGDKEEQIDDICIIGVRI